MTEQDRKNIEFKRTARTNMIASLRLEGIDVNPKEKQASVAELKEKYARQIRY
mgnify:CR=1 FL=1